MTTRFQATISDVTITAQADPDQAAAVSGLFYVLRSLPPGTLVDGRPVLLHGNLFVLRASDDGLTIHAPDYLGDPDADLTDDLTLALWVMNAQAQLLRRFGPEGQPTRWDDTIVVQKGVLDAEAVYLHRTPTERERDSGWYVGAVGGDDPPRVDELERIRAYELLSRRPALVPLLALPDGHLAIVVGDEIDGVQGPDGEMLPDLAAQSRPRSP
ncbi:hypothetical protein [Sanguibacter sp. 25GB23B1]|uniref:immunity protein Imm33 domain-containing protein n=1 Tax=unclassified Sanguibacter TaxID=2645534 RepID=UPI0032AEE1B2